MGFRLAPAPLGTATGVVVGGAASAGQVVSGVACCLMWTRGRANSWRSRSCRPRRGSARSRRRRTLSSEPSTDPRSQPIRVQGLRQPADHGLRGAASGLDSQRGCGLRLQVSDPLTDRCVGAVSGDDRADRRSGSGAPRAGQVKASSERLSDRVAVGVLTCAFPPSLVDDVLARTGRDGRSSAVAVCCLPRVGVYFVLAMCLFSGQGYEEVIRLLTEGLRQRGRWRGGWMVPYAPNGAD